MITLKGTQNRIAVLEPHEPITLPDLTVIIGPNGVGKSVLLGAIADTNIKVALDGGQDDLPDAQIRLLRNGDVFSVPTSPTNQSMPSMPDSHSQLDSHRDATLMPARRILVDRFGDERVRDVGELWRDGSEVLFQTLDTGAPDDREVIDTAFAKAENIMRGDEPGGHSAMEVKRGVQVMAARLGKPLLAITDQEWQVSRRAESVIDPLQPAITTIFQQYGIAWRRNIDLAIEDQYRDQPQALPRDQMQQALGRPPWELIGEALEAFGLPYNVGSIDLQTPQPNFDFRLVRKDNGANLDVSQLSSGEQVLLRFALAIFDFTQMDYRLTMPRLLLCDELDASLHPEILDQWIRAIRYELVERLGIKCILTTHSPITAALVEEASLFELLLGAHGMKQVSKQAALNRLLVGVPALAVDYSNRRQVLVESEADAGVYQAILEYVKPHIDLPRSLDFIAAAKKGAGDAGCSAVRHLVETAAGSGNVSMFGLLDWDGKNVGDDRIVVMGEGERYALENAIYDPLLLGIYLIGKGLLPDYEEMSTDMLSLMSATDRQAMMDKVQSLVRFPHSANTAVTTVGYVDGTTAQVRDAWLKWRGHYLEDAIVEAIPRLYPTAAAGAGRLMRHVVTETVPIFPGFTPRVVADAFQKLSSRELSEQPAD